MPEQSLSLSFKPSPNVHKFGGTSLSTAVKIDQVVQTIEEQVRAGDYVVVSANGKVTDLLLDLMQGQKKAWIQLLSYLNELFEESLSESSALLAQVNLDLNKISEIIKRSRFNEHQVLAYGELWSAQLLSAKLNELQQPNQWVDARELFVVDVQNNLANSNAARQMLLKRRVHNHASQADEVIHIVTGFIARDEAGNCTTLGRNGSDYTATLIADLLQTPAVYLWTDVDGVYTADPNVITDARRISDLTLSEAQALSELGSHVLHQKTMAPLLQQSTKIIINCCEKLSNGTAVERSVHSEIKQVKTLAHKSDLVALSVSGLSELEARQFQTRLTAAQINNYANHFDKTQNKLSFYVENLDWFKTTQLIKAAGLTTETQEPGISLISAVGQHIRQNTQVISKILNRSDGFPVHQIHYPANDHTLCVLLPDEHAADLLEDLHQTFFNLEPSMPIVVLGYGNIGRQFLHILKANKGHIEQQVNQALSVVAVANSRFYQYSQHCLLEQCIDLNQTNNQGQLQEELAQYRGKPAVIIDLTASEEVAKQYLGFAENSWHIISANKLAAADASWADQINQALSVNQRLWQKNTTVGAALPVQSSIKNIQANGDQIKSVSGVFSGSLSWLFSQYDGQTPFMDWVRQAHEQAFTEPDPRDDLSGQDVYRKALILAHELGFTPQKIVFEPVIPENYLEGSIEQFWQHQDNINVYMQGLWQQAQQQDQSLCYLAKVTAEELRVQLKLIDSNHAAAQLQPSDNIFIIESDWYADNPLVIQGPGAGREVTAAGVLTDLIEVLQSS